MHQARFLSRVTLMRIPVTRLKMFLLSATRVKIYMVWGVRSCSRFGNQLQGQ